MVDSQPLTARRNAISCWISIGHVMVSCAGLLQNLLHSGLKRFGLRPRLCRFNLLVRQLRFQFSAETISSTSGTSRCLVAMGHFRSHGDWRWRWGTGASEGGQRQ
jgi:hypothetical protein